LARRANVEYANRGFEAYVTTTVDTSYRHAVGEGRREECLAVADVARSPRRATPSSP